MFCSTKLTSHHITNQESDLTIGRSLIILSAHSGYELIFKDDEIDIVDVKVANKRK